MQLVKDSKIFGYKIAKQDTGLHTLWEGAQRRIAKGEIIFLYNVVLR